MTILHSQIVREARKVLTALPAGECISRPRLAKALQKALALPKNAVPALTQIVQGAVTLGLFDNNKHSFDCRAGRDGGIFRMEAEGVSEADLDAAAE